MAIDDATLVVRFQYGDASALDTLIERHQVKAYQFAFRLTRDPEMACDVVAEAFVRVCRSLRNFRADSAFTTWLYRIITNCFLDLRKKIASKPAVSLEHALSTDEGEVERQIVGTCLCPHAECERRELNAVLSAAIEKLPESYRTMILLFHADTQSYEEIAAKLRLPLGTVKSRLNRARTAMSVILGPDREMLTSA